MFNVNQSEIAFSTKYYCFYYGSLRDFEENIEFGEEKNEF